MRLLDKLLEKKAPEFTERIWSTSAQKIDDLVAQVRKCSTRGVYPVAVAHFPATQQRLLDAFGAGGIEARGISSPSQFPSEFPDERSPQTAIPVLSSEAIPPQSQRAPMAQAGVTRTAPVSVHLAEHYPTPDRDQGVLALATIWPTASEFTCYTALDEPWLIPFGVERVRQLIARVGMDEATVLSHPVLHRALRNAQQRIAEQVPHEQRCDSCEEWVRCNLPRVSA